MSQSRPEQQQPVITLNKTAEYRDSYANSVQVRLSVWDFMLIFGTLGSQSPTEVTVDNFQGVYLSPQQAKALHNVLTHNLTQYEQTFGTISLEGAQSEPQPYIIPGNGPIH
jgi:hypothetical protein